MMDFLRKHQYKIFIFLIGVILFGTLIGFGSYTFSGGSAGDSIAEVNGQKIPVRIFLSHYNRALSQASPGSAPDQATRQLKRDETTRDLVQSVVFANQAKAHGIVVPDQQVAISLTQIQAFQENGSFNPQLYMQALQSQIRMTPQDFEEEQRNSIAFFKLRWLIQSVIKITDKEFEIEAPLRMAGKPFKDAKEKDAFRQQLWQEKVIYSFNQWFTQLSQNLKVKTHFEILEGGR